MGCEWYDPLSYGSCVGNVAKSAASDAFHSIAESFGQAADHAVSWLWSQINAATAVHLGGAGFGLEIGITAAIAGTVAVGLFTIQLIQSVLRRDPGGLARAAKGLLIAFIGGAVAIAVVNVLLDATDSLCSGVVKVATGTNVAGLGKLILGTGALTTTINGSAALLLLSLACIAATVIVYAALVVRKVLIVVTAVFAPIAFAGSLADITVSWTRRWIETTVALVASKLVLVLVFLAGYGILVEGVGQSGSGTTQQVTQVIAGVMVLFLAGFAPWLALKVVHFTGEHAQHLHALGTSAVGGVAAAGRMAQKATPYVSGGAVPAAVGAGAYGGASAGGAATGSWASSLRGAPGPSSAAVAQHGGSAGNTGRPATGDGGSTPTAMGEGAGGPQSGTTGQSGTKGKATPTAPAGSSARAPSPAEAAPPAWSSQPAAAPASSRTAP